MIIAIDPGPHVGIARWYPDHIDKDSQFQMQTLDFTRRPDDAFIGLYDFLQTTVYRGDTVVLERFEYQREKAQQRNHLDFTAAEHVGAVKLWYQLHITMGVKLVLQSPGQAVGNEAREGDDNDHGIFWTRAKLEKLGLWKMCKSNHERSALRHLLYHVSFGVGDKRFILALK